MGASLRRLAEARLRRGLEWIADRRELCRPADLFEAQQLKELAELSILHGALGAWGFDDLPPVEKVGAFVLEVLGAPAASEWVRKLPSAFSPYVLAYLPLRALGHRISGFEEAIVRLRKVGYPAALETVPYRELELRHMMWQAGLGPRPTATGAYRRTALGRCWNPIYFSLDEVYSTTHTLIYLTDVCGPAPELPAGVRARAESVVEPLLLHFWRKGDWDVSGELLLNALSLDLHHRPLFEGAFTALLEGWREEGWLPGPSAEPIGPDANERERFDSAYHTTLVGVLLCAAYVHRTAG